MHVIVIGYATQIPRYFCWGLWCACLLSSNGDGLGPGALSIRPKILEIPGCGANGTDIFRNFFPKFWVYLARLA